MNNEFFAYDPADERSTVREHNQRLEEESLLERDRRCSGSYVDERARLARAIERLTGLARPHLERHEAE